MNMTIPANTTFPAVLNHASTSMIVGAGGDSRKSSSLARHNLTGSGFQGWGPRL